LDLWIKISVSRLPLSNSQKSLKMSSLFIFNFLFIFFIQILLSEAEQFNRSFKKCVTKTEEEGECKLVGFCSGESSLNATLCNDFTLLPRVCCPTKPQKQSE